MHRHTASFKQARNLTAGYREARNELRAAMEPGQHVQYEDVPEDVDAEEFLTQELHQEWLRNLQQERYVVCHSKKKTTIRSSRTGFSSYEAIMSQLFRQ